MSLLGVVGMLLVGVLLIGALVVIGPALRQVDTKSYRSEAGVKINITTTPRGTRYAVDFEDEQTREAMLKRLEKYLDLVPENGKLVRRPK